MTLTLEIPDFAIASMEMPPEQLQNELRRELAVGLYSRGVLPIGKAMELGALTRRDFERLLKERGIRRPFDEAELDRELHSLAQD